MSKDNPLDPIRAAREEGYFRAKNDKLIAQLRERLKEERLADDLSAAGVADEALVEALLGLGIDRTTLPVLNLAPLLQVAWADGEIQAEERKLLLEAARAQGIEAGSEADTTLAGLLDEPPGQAFYASAMVYIRAVLAATEEDNPAAADAARNDLTGLARQVALSHGKLFGVFGTGLAGVEKDALDSIATQLTMSHKGAASELLGKLSED